MSSQQQQQQQPLRTTKGQPERSSQPQKSSRQPLGVKNSISIVNMNNVNSKADISKGEELYPIKPIPNTHHLAPPVRLRKSASSPPINTTSNTSITPSMNQRVYTSHHPSPLGLKAQDLPGSDENSSTSSKIVPASLSPSIIKTPKKRAIPLEDVHVRNAVPGNNQVDESPKSNKRSRSSKNGSSATDPSTSTSLSIATGLGDVNLQSQGAATTTASLTTAAPIPHPLPSHHTIQPTHTSRTSVPPAPPLRQTTTRIDKQSRMTENDRHQRERQKIETQKEWRKKFLRAFPSFHFHLDGFDEATRKEATLVVEQLGGTIEPFFSNTVSHLVTTRKVPVGVIPEAQIGPLALVLPSPRAGETARTTSMPGGPTRTATSSIRPSQSASSRFPRLPALRKKNTNVPLHSDRNPFEESGPPLPSNDILVKARNAGMKVWTLDKFRTVMSSLLGEEVHADSKKQQNLAQILDKGLGVLERDPMAARENYHFFPKNSAYILVEDATGEHRSIMVQEWKKPVSENDKIPWPVLYGQLEGRCPFSKFEYDGDLRKRMKPNRHETLKRSVSLSHLNRGGLGISPAPSGDSRAGYSINRGASPYPLASGNSVSLTSNIASTTSTVMTAPGGLGLIPPYGAGALGRKVNQANAIGLGRPSSMANNTRSSHSSTATGNAISTTNEQSHGSLVRRMLGITEQNRNSNLALIRRSVSTASAGHQLRHEKKPGYCENCRSKYDDFDEHIVGRKHRKFAEDDSHFTEIDALLHRVARPIASWALGCTSSTGSAVEVETFSNSSLMAAGGSLLEVEGAEDELNSSERRSHLRSPRGFMDDMHQWQQNTLMTEQRSTIASPYSHHSQAISLCQEGAKDRNGDEDFIEQESNSSHGNQTTAGDTTATTMDHQTEISQSPDTSPHIHYQYHHSPQHFFDDDDNHEVKEQDESASIYGTAI